MRAVHKGLGLSMSKSQLTLCSLPMFSMDAAMHYPNLAGIFAMGRAGQGVVSAMVSVWCS